MVGLSPVGVMMPLRPPEGSVTFYYVIQPQKYRYGRLEHGCWAPEPESELHCSRGRKIGWNGPGCGRTFAWLFLLKGSFRWACWDQAVSSRPRSNLWVISGFWTGGLRHAPDLASATRRVVGAWGRGVNVNQKHSGQYWANSSDGK